MEQLLDFHTLSTMKGNLASKLLGDNIGSPIMLMLLFGLAKLVGWMTEHASLDEAYRIMDRLGRGKIRDNRVVLTGEVRSKVTSWRDSITPLMSNQFRAVLWRASNRLGCGVHAVEEFILSDEAVSEKSEAVSPARFFVCAGKKPFFIDDSILCTIEIKQTDNGGHEHNASKSNIATITLSSSVRSVEQLVQYVNGVEQAFRKACLDQTKDKLFIYRFKGQTSDEWGVPWTETPFESFRTFDNMLFDGKEEFLKKVNFFNENRRWYKEHGHPYTLGIGLHGPPGTGKTCIIKALANHLRRHIIEIPLGLIESEQGMLDAYFERNYGRAGRSLLNFEDKIIVFDDIDAQADFTKRGCESPSSKLAVSTKPPLIESGKDGVVVSGPTKPKLTLSTFLSVLDGVRENMGRITIICSNHYDELDPALTRRGRIDIEMEMGPVNLSVVNDFCKRHYNKGLPSSLQKQYADVKIRPCNVVSILKQGIDYKTFARMITQELADVQGGERE